MTKYLILGITNTFMFTLLIIIASHLSKITSITLVYSYIILVSSTIALILLLIKGFKNDLHEYLYNFLMICCCFAYYCLILALIWFFCEGITKTLNNVFGPVLKILFLLLFIPTGFMSIILAVLFLIIAVCC